jgi:hypothetical protein
MKLAYIAMGLKVASALMKTRGAMTLARGGGGIASGIGTAVALVAVGRLARNLLTRR